MKLRSPHKDWKLELLLVPDARAIGMDQLLTQLWLRIAHENRPTTRRAEPYSRVAEIAAKIEERGRTAFGGFDQAEGTAEAWLRADLLRVFKRAPHEYSVARPLHLQATRLRNARRDKDSGGSEVVYKWLQDEGPDVLEDLRSWIDVDPEKERLDLASYALVRLAEDEEPDVPKADPQVPASPLCRTPGRRYVGDVRRLLAYRGVLPRAVIVDHLRRLTALHLGLYLLVTFRAVIDLEREQRQCAGCEGGRADESSCYSLELIADCGDDARSHVARLAEASWQVEEQVLSAYVRSHLTLRKLMELAPVVGRKPLPVNSLEAIANVVNAASRAKLDQQAANRISSLIDGAAAGDDQVKLTELQDQYERLDLDPFRVYMALLFNLGERRWFNYLRFVLDSVFMKNERDGAMRQPLGGRRQRRLALSPALLETLVLVALVQDVDGVMETRSMRVDQLTDHLRNRYGLLIASPPTALAADAAATRAMIENHALFRRRLRQAGLFVDLSDAFLAQTIRPRVELGR